jgi:hypothetical protein
LAKRVERIILKEQMTAVLNDLLKATSRSFFPACFLAETD